MIYRNIVDCNNWIRILDKMNPRHWVVYPVFASSSNIKVQTRREVNFRILLMVYVKCSNFTPVFSPTWDWLEQRVERIDILDIFSLRIVFGKWKLI